MIQLILIAILSLVAQLFLPWWSLALVAFGVCFWRGQSAGGSFVQGFVGVAVVWLIYAFFLHSRTDGVFTGRMSELLFKTNTSVLPLLVTALVGGLVGGLAAWSGFLLKQATGAQPTQRTTR